MKHRCEHYQGVCNRLVCDREVVVSDADVSRALVERLAGHPGIGESSRTATLTVVNDTLTQAIDAERAAWRYWVASSRYTARQNWLQALSDVRAIDPNYTVGK